MIGIMRSAIFLPAPPGWREATLPKPPGSDARAFVSTDGGLSAICDTLTIDGKRWLHVSVSRRSRTPSFEDLDRARIAFVGDDVPTYHVFPKANEHRNLHPFCLHLWTPLEADPFPDPLLERADAVAPADVTSLRRLL